MTETIIALEIVIGVPKAVNDPNTNEPALQVINLLNVRGFGVQYPDGWTPQLPSLKNGGTWSDSALSSGRQLIAGEFGNVIETMTLKATGATMTNRLFLKSQLLEFSRRAKAFHTDWSEQQPVYIKWHAPGGHCPQYALIYDIDVSDVGDAFEVYDADTIVITIEREPAWRMGVPPGGNPLLWTYFSRDAVPGNTYQYDDLALTNSSALVTASIFNRHEWTYNGGAPVTTPSSKNYVDITAAQVPGDAPALVCVAARSNSFVGGTILRRLLMWHSSRELSGVDQIAGTAMAGGYIMNAADMNGLGVSAVATAGNVATGVNNTALVPAKQYVAVGLGGGGSVVTLNSSGTTSNFTVWWRQLLRGRFAVYVRARMVTGTLGDTKLRVTVNEMSNVSTLGITAIDLPEINIPQTTSTGQYNLLYCGQVTIPFEGKSHVGYDGRGLYLKNYIAGTTPFDLRVDFRFRDTTAVANPRTVHFLDAILVPMDEAFAEFRYNDFTSSADHQTFFMDNTGYLSRGKLDEVAMRAENSGSYVTNKPANPIEQRGNMPTLLPRRNQRLYFLNTKGTAPELSTPDTDMEVFVNIVPRCYGVAAL